MGLFRGLRGRGRGRGFLSCELVVLLVVLFAFVFGCFLITFGKGGVRVWDDFVLPL